MNDEKRRLRVKGRRTSGSFLKLDKELLAHPNFVKLTPRGVKLLVDLGYYYNGSNNGDLTTAMTILKERGWRSNSNLVAALEELRYYQFVKVTRQGCKGICTLVLLTFFPVNESKGKHSFRTTPIAPNDYKATKKRFNPKHKGGIDYDPDL
jgi:hypothetical protein|tara:strand:- start:230 stop:682 length:453 start_codon:yes stop_codon:yes gene_type:complete